MLYREGTTTDIRSEKGSMCTGGDPGGAAAQDFRLEEQKRAMGGPPIGKTQKAFRRNIEAAQELESRAAATKPTLPTPAGVGLSGIAKLSLRNQANILRKQSVSATPVRDESDRTVGVVSKNIFGGEVYSGRSEFNPLGDRPEEQRGEPVSSAPTPDPVKEEVEVAMTPVGGNSGRTTKSRRGGGRRTSFGTRQSLVNLRNV